METARGLVSSVSRNEVYSFTKPVHDEIVLVAGLGVEGDSHSGVHVRHQGRVRADPTQPNLRQVHLIHEELFTEVGAKGYEVRPGHLGENVTTSGIDLLGLPVGTILRFGLPRAGSDDDRAAANGAVANGAVANGAAGRENAPDVGGDRAAGGAGSHDVTLGVRPLSGKPPAGEVLDPESRDGEGGAAQAGGLREREGGAAQAGLPGREGGGLDGVLAAAAAATLDEPAARAADAVRAAVAREEAAAEVQGVDPRPAVVVAGLRNPCGQINGLQAGLLKEMVGHDDEGNVVRKGGIMTVVLRGGPVRPGDLITAELPPPPHAPLERV